MDAQENELLTRVGRGTPMGELLRRYWWPIWFSEKVEKRPVPVRLLGEDLVVFRKPSGALGLVSRYCPHRGASLAYGRAEEIGLRCCYHGWAFDGDGQCVDTPLEPEGSRFKDMVKIDGYPVQEMAGLIFAYLGPKPVPALPRYDLLCWDDSVSLVSANEQHCNWLQRAENTVDQAHVNILHASVYPSLAMTRPVIEWEKQWYGMRITADSGRKQPKVTHFIFPSSNRITRARIGDTPSHDIYFRVPIDDTLTWTFGINVYPGQKPAAGTNGRDVRGMVHSAREEFDYTEDGWFGLPSKDQDKIAQESQGLIANRSVETLGTTDRGIVMLRRMLHDSLDAIRDGRDPIGVIRDDDPRNIIDFDASMDELETLKA
jgi:5,5'-dehydrodivanillate O-demethylase